MWSKPVRRKRVIGDPQHAYTRLLIDSIPWPEVGPRHWGSAETARVSARPVVPRSRHDPETVYRGGIAGFDAEPKDKVHVTSGLRLTAEKDLAQRLRLIAPKVARARRPIDRFTPRAPVGCHGHGPTLGAARAARQGTRDSSGTVTGASRTCIFALRSCFVVPRGWARRRCTSLSARG